MINVIIAKLLKNKMEDKETFANYSTTDYIILVSYILEVFFTLYVVYRIVKCGNKEGLYIFLTLFIPFGIFYVLYKVWKC